jgi:hypothetical protein
MISQGDGGCTTLSDCSGLGGNPSDPLSLPKGWELKPIGECSTKCIEPGSDTTLPVVPGTTLTSSLSNSVLSYLSSSWFGGGDIYSFTAGGFSPAVRPGNFGFSGNGLWGLRGHYYTGESISNGFINETLSGAVPGSVLAAMATNAIDYSFGPHANEGVWSQGYASSTTVDSMSNYVSTAGPALIFSTAVFSATPPGWVIAGTIGSGLFASYIFNVSGGSDAAKKGLNSTIDWFQAVGSGQPYSCDGWACR